jgi:hypothetical protein
VFLMASRSSILRKQSGRNGEDRMSNVSRKIHSRPTCSVHHRRFGHGASDPAHIADMPFLSSDVKPKPLTSLLVGALSHPDSPHPRVMN